MLKTGLEILNAKGHFNLLEEGLDVDFHILVVLVVLVDSLLVVQEDNTSEVINSREFDLQLNINHIKYQRGLQEITLVETGFRLVHEVRIHQRMTVLPFLNVFVINSFLFLV